MKNKLQNIIFRDLVVVADVVGLVPAIDDDDDDGDERF